MPPRTGSKAPGKAPARLREYQRKRDFARTPEPSGDGVPSAPPSGSSRFVVQRHRARRLHYDFRLEMDGVLVSWAVPKGPTLDPKARSLAVHVEDHPLDYFDFEGTIPRGQYGGGDVIVWDWGTWELAKGDDPVAAVADGDLHIDLHGEKLRGRFVLVRRGGAQGGKEQWLLLHKHDEHAVEGWDPEAHPHSVKTGRTNDEVLASPDATWQSNRAEPAAPARAKASPRRREVPTFAGPTDDELAALEEIEREGVWELGGKAVKVTSLDKVMFPRKAGRKGGGAVTKRDLLLYAARIAPWVLPYLADRPVNFHRYPAGVDKPGFWHKALPPHAPAWMARWENTEAEAGETECYAVLDSAASLVFMANFGAVEWHGWTSRLPDVHEPTWALVDIDPGPETSWDQTLTMARLFRTALEHLQVQGMPKVTGQRGVQVWIPIAPGSSFDDTRVWVEALSKAVGRTVPELVSWSWQKRDRAGLARLDYTQNAINKTLVAPFSPRPRAGAPVSVPITWDELDDPDLRPDRWNLRTVLDRLAEVGDPLAGLIGLEQRLPDLV